MFSFISIFLALGLLLIFSLFPSFDFGEIEKEKKIETP